VHFSASSNRALSPWCRVGSPSSRASAAIPPAPAPTIPAGVTVPHLYLQFKAEGKTHSVYVPPEQGEALKSAHAAWLRFQEIGAQLSAGNRERWLRELKRERAGGQGQAGKARRKALK